MKEYSLSYHPVWEILSYNGLPPEIINKIFQYYSIFTPINYCFKEYNQIIKHNKFMIQNDQYCYENIFLMLQEIIFKFRNRTNTNFIKEFIDKFSCKYNLSSENILELFGSYYLKMYSLCNINQKMHLAKKIDFICYKSIPEFHLDYIKQLLKNLLTINYNNKIIKIKNSTNIDDYFILDSFDYDNDKFYLDKLWSNIKFISLLRSEKCLSPFYRTKLISKAELLMFNFILAIPYKKTWEKDKLLRNIYKTEPPEENNLLKYFDDKHELYNLTQLYIVMKTYPFSSINKNNKEIDTNKTLNMYVKNYKLMFHIE